MGILKAFFAAFLGKLLADEIRAWMPWLSEGLLKMAISRLPMDLRERYQEEWAADLDSYPGGVAKIFRALGFVCAGLSITSSPLAVIKALFVCLFSDRATSIRTVILYLGTLAPVFVMHLKYGFPIPWFKLVSVSLVVSVPFLYVMQQFLLTATKRGTPSD